MQSGRIAFGADQARIEQCLSQNDAHRRRNVLTPTSGPYAVGVDYGNPISYLVLNAGADVISSDGKLVGKLEHVLADPESDVFDGLVIDIHLGPGGSTAPGI
jgi:hypothetical protein